MARPKTSATPGIDWRVWLIPALLLLAAAPLGGRYLYFLTKLPQYEFTIAFLLGWIGIVAMRRKEYFADAIRPSRLGVAFNVAAFLALAMGIFIASSWFIYLAFIFFVGGVFCFAGNKRPDYPLLPLWAALLIPLRPPLGYDQAALNQLRLVASEGASRIADMIAVPHLLEGNVFSLADKQMFMDDACSGIISLLTCMACAALIAIWKRRGFLHFLLLVAIGGFWAVMFNIARVVCLLCAWHWFAIDLTSGWKHDVLGYIALSGGVLCLIASDLSLHWLLQDTNDVRSRLTSFWNRRIANAQIDLIEIAPAGAAIDIRRQFPQFERQELILSAILTSLVIFQLPREINAMYKRRKSLNEFAVESIKPAPFPATFRDWRNVPDAKVENVWRLRNEIKSTQSLYRRRSESMIVAVAYPYDHWHDITGCYTMNKWRIGLRTVPAQNLSAASANRTRRSIVHLELNRQNTENATVLFAFVNSKGEPVEAPGAIVSVSELLRRGFGFQQETNPNFEGFLVQALWPRSDSQTSTADFKEKLAQFEEILDRIRVDWTAGR